MERKNKRHSALFVVLGMISTLTLGFTFGKLAGEINPQTIDSAAGIIGLSFSPAEKDSMISRLEFQLRNLEASREYKLDNSIAPALVFNPLPVGFEPETRQMPVDFGLAENVQLPSRDVDIAYTPVHELAV
ncbi:MAG: amidase, partial [Cyclobacteriaceae bacterium]|nr:amidase [Cyclobacteriaceae bacterium]